MLHKPVLLHEVLAAVDPKPGEFFIDGTLGAGGYTREIAQRAQPGGHVLAIDLDQQAVDRFNTHPVERAQAVQGNFANIPQILEGLHLPKADGLVVDLGFSSNQLEAGGRGLSFQNDEPLIMAYDRASERSAAAIVNSYTEWELRDLIKELSDERYAGAIAKNIVKARKKERILTTRQLVEIIEGSVPKGYERGRIHPATRTFLALRMEVNRELQNLQDLLTSIEQIVKPGGRIAVVSFQSSEDRLVKTIFREKEKEHVIELINRKPIMGTDEELETNPRARSAKLRAAKLVNYES